MSKPPWNGGDSLRKRLLNIISSVLCRCFCSDSKVGIYVIINTTDAKSAAKRRRHFKVVFIEHNFLIFHVAAKLRRIRLKLCYNIFVDMLRMSQKLRFCCGIAVGFAADSILTASQKCPLQASIFASWYNKRKECQIRRETAATT